MRSLIAREQWKRYRKNWEIARGRLVEEGIHVTAIIPVGYDRNGLTPLVPNKDEAAVRELIQR